MDHHRAGVAEVRFSRPPHGSGNRQNLARRAALETFPHASQRPIRRGGVVARSGVRRRECRSRCRGGLGLPSPRGIHPRARRGGRGVCPFRGRSVGFSPVRNGNRRTTRNGSRPFPLRRGSRAVRRSRRAKIPPPSAPGRPGTPGPWTRRNRFRAGSSPARAALHERGVLHPRAVQDSQRQHRAAAGAHRRQGRRGGEFAGGFQPRVREHHRARAAQAFGQAERVGAIQARVQTDRAETLALVRVEGFPIARRFHPGEDFSTAPFCRSPISRLTFPLHLAYAPTPSASRPRLGRRRLSCLS